MAPRKERERDLVPRNDHNETRPPHRGHNPRHDPGGVLFETTHERVHAQRQERNPKKKGLLSEAMAEYMTPDGRIRYND